MKKGLIRKLVYLGVALCVIASMLAFACAEPEPETPTTETPTTETPTTETPTTETPTTETPTTETPTTETPKEPWRSLPYGGVYVSEEPVASDYILKIISHGQRGFDNLGAPTIPIPFWNPMGPSPCVERLLIWDEHGILEPYLAKDWEWSADRMSVDLYLQEGVKFHDGTNFNAQAVKDVLWRMVASNSMWLKSIESIDVLDDYTVRLNLNKLDNLVLYDLAATGGVMQSPTATETYGEEYCMTYPVGTGAYKFVSMERDVDLIYTKNPDWWQGEPFLGGIEFARIADAVTAKSSFLAGEGDIFGYIPPVDAKSIKDMNKYNMYAAKSDLSAITGDGVNEDSMFSDIRIRQALTYALDTEAITEAVGYGFYEVANQASHDVLWSYNPDIKGYPYDPEKAKQLLIEAGYPNGFNTKLVYETGNPTVEQTALIAQDMYAKVGIVVDLEPAKRARTQELGAFGWNNHLMFAGSLLSVGFSPFNSIGLHYTGWGPYSVSQLNNEHIDSTLAAAQAEPDQDKMAEIMREVLRLLFDEYCVQSPIYINSVICAQEKWVHGGGLYNPWSDDWRPWTFWVTK